jgi:hypothetical protein
MVRIVVFLFVALLGFPAGAAQVTVSVPDEVVPYGNTVCAYLDTKIGAAEASTMKKCAEEIIRLGFLQLAEEAIRVQAAQQATQNADAEVDAINEAWPPVIAP